MERPLTSHTRVSSVHVITRTYDYGLVSTFLGETIGLFILFVLWLVGAAIATVRPRCFTRSFAADVVPATSRYGVTSHGATNIFHAVFSQRSSHSPGWASSSSSSSSSSASCSPLRIRHSGSRSMADTTLVQATMVRRTECKVTFGSSPAESIYVDAVPLLLSVDMYALCDKIFHTSLGMLICRPIRAGFIAGP